MCHYKADKVLPSNALLLHVKLDQKWLELLHECHEGLYLELRVSGLGRVNSILQRRAWLSRFRQVYLQPASALGSSALDGGLGLEGRGRGRLRRPAPGRGSTASLPTSGVRSDSSGRKVDPPKPYEDRNARAERVELEERESGGLGRAAG